MDASGSGPSWTAPSHAAFVCTPQAMRGECDLQATPWFRARVAVFSLAVPCAHRTTHTLLYPRNVEIDVHFKGIACGDRHTLALTSYVEGASDPNSRVYAWGDGGSGRLGNGGDNDKWYPTLIKHWMGAKPTPHAAPAPNRGAPYPVDVASISAGGRHSAAVTAEVSSCWS